MAAVVREVKTIKIKVILSSGIYFLTCVLKILFISSNLVIYLPAMLTLLILIVGELVLDEFAYKIFDIKKDEKLDFMQKAVTVRKEWRKKIQGVTHSDNTARVQTVSDQSNSKFYRLISEFYKITKIPVLVNTSFNLNGQPIVTDPEDAIKTFYTCGLDYLVMGNYIVSKDEMI